MERVISTLFDRVGLVLLNAALEAAVLGGDLLLVVLAPPAALPWTGVTGGRPRFLLNGYEGSWRKKYN